jgi:2-methylisocitrate lyase-like PEP mutase family enzyme
MSAMTDKFRALHSQGTFVMPNPWDLGTARFLQSLGFAALATTSWGFAASLGRLDQTVTRDEMLAHTSALVGAIDVPLNVDSERCYAEDLAGVTKTVRLLGDAGAAGCSIEDYDPVTKTIDPIGLATERVAAAAEGARASGLVLTARAENPFYGFHDLDDTIARLCSYRDAGAEVMYAPGLTNEDQIRRVVAETGVPVNVLARSNGPSVSRLGELGVRRISTGGALARASFELINRAARELLDHGTSNYTVGSLTAEDYRKAFG